MTPRPVCLRPLLLVALGGGLLGACASPGSPRGDAIAPGEAVWPATRAVVDPAEGGDVAAVDGSNESGGAGGVGVDGEPVPSAMPDAAAELSDAVSPASAGSETAWHDIAAGLSTRRAVVNDAAGQRIERPMLVRVDPGRYRFEVAYRPGAPQSLSAWQAETGAAVVVNAGYFTEENVATGRIVSAGTPSGLSYGAFAGMFAVTESGPEVRWLGERPYDEAEPLQEAVQSFPILVRPDGGAAYSEEDGRVARRTIVGQDRAGRIVLAVMPMGGLSLRALSEWLATARDLDLRLAFNLDGGASSGLLLPDGTGDPGLVPVPAVIVARER
ncbi:MAG: phosphodiester glycosidase family protein [Ardenticatenales bacterium]